MCFSLFCNVFCTCLHYSYVRIYWAKRLQREQTHVHTIILHSHEHILLAMMKWNDFAKPRYLHPAIFFTTVNIWVRESTITFKYAQQATTTAHTFISSCCFDLFCYFFIFLNFWEQVWAKLGSFWHTDQQCNTLINCEQNDCGKAKSYSQGVTTTKWRHHFLFFFTFIMTCSEQTTTVKWRKSEKKWHFEQNWAGFARAPIHILVFWAILSKIEQNWAGFTGAYQYFF